MVSSVSGKASIIGFGEETMVKGNPLNYWSLMALSSQRAIADARLDKNEIDGLVTVASSWTLFNTAANVFMEYMGLRGVTHCRTLPYIGGMYYGAFQEAMYMIVNGLAKNVLVVSADSQNLKYSRAESIQNHAQYYCEPQWERPFGGSIPAIYATIAQRYMHEYGATNEQFAAVKVAATKWALMHPLAMQKTPVTIDDVLNSPIAFSPLHLLDFSMFGGAGGFAFVLTSTDRARARAGELKNAPVRMEAFEIVPSQQFWVSYRDSMSISDELAVEVPAAYQAAGIGPKDVDLFYTCDTTTCGVLQALEDCGFCERGEAGHFVAAGQIEPGGALPTNTSGGSLSGRHPGGSVLVMSQLAEMMTQLRGEAGPRQVPGAEVAAVAYGGTAHSSQSYSIWRRLD
jgi:acetyl-CoA acetyltransferase